MHVQKSTLSRFDTRSLAFFASLALSGGLATAQPVFGPSVPSKPAANAVQANSTSTPPVVDAFRQADADGDGNISRKEATRSGSLVRSFDKLDGNKDGVLSRAELDKSPR